MGKFRGRNPKFAAIVASLALAAGTLATGAIAQEAGPYTPARAGMTTAGMSGAEKLRRLDIMLMVTGLRCRMGADDFMADYGSFTSHHMRELNGAADDLRAEYAARFGAAGGKPAMDRMDVSMANQFGDGHPWLGCHELHVAAQSLAMVEGRTTLEEAADQLLAGVPARWASSR